MNTKHATDDQENCRGLRLQHRWASGEFTGREFCTKCGEMRHPPKTEAEKLAYIDDFANSIARLDPRPLQASDFDDLVRDEMRIEEERIAMASVAVVSSKWSHPIQVAFQSKCAQSGANFWFTIGSGKTRNDAYIDHLGWLGAI